MESWREVGGERGGSDDRPIAAHDELRHAFAAATVGWTYGTREAKTKQSASISIAFPRQAFAVATVDRTACAQSLSKSKPSPYQPLALFPCRHGLAFALFGRGAASLSSVFCHDCEYAVCGICTNRGICRSGGGVIVTLDRVGSDRAMDVAAAVAFFARRALLSEKQTPRALFCS